MCFRNFFALFLFSFPSFYFLNVTLERALNSPAYFNEIGKRKKKKTSPIFFLI